MVSSLVSQQKSQNVTISLLVFKWHIYVLLPLTWAFLSWFCPAFWQQDQKMVWTTKMYRLHVIDTVKCFTQELLCSFIFRTAMQCFTVSHSKCVMLQTREKNWSSNMQKHWASYGTNRASCNGWWNTAQVPVLKKRARTMKQLKHCRYVSFNISFLEQLNRTWFPCYYNSLYI